MSKLRTSIDAFLKSEGLHAKLDHLTAMECSSTIATCFGSNAKDSNCMCIL